MASIDTTAAVEAAKTAAGVQRLSIDGSGNVIINDTGASCDVRIEGDTDANLLITDGSADRVGVGVAAPTEKLDVNGNVKATDFLIGIGSTSVYETLGTYGERISTAQTTAENAAISGARGRIRGATYVAPTDEVFITPVNKNLTDGSAVSLFEVSIPNSGDTCGGHFAYRIHCWNGTDFQSHCGIANYAAGNKAGTVTSAIGHSSGVGGLETEIESSGTLTDTFAITNGTGKITITLNANTSLTSLSSFYVTYTLFNDSSNYVTIL